LIAKYGSIRGLVNLHRLVYELQSKGVLKTDFTFIKYSFGYYSKDLEELLSTLRKLELIRIRRSGDGTEVVEITETGLRVLEAVKGFKEGSVGRI
jgi:predicted transcriptional regulator